jgi:predicted DNA-binding transcriptional regulator YafY
MDAAARLLRLLSLLQVQPAWTGSELAARLAVTGRTLRRDVVRLRDLGYPIDATPGVDGGYRLGTGGRLPPLLLDDDEAVAIAVGLRVAATTTVSGAESAALAALTKLEQMMPAGLRERVSALHTSTTQLRGGDLPQIDADVLVTLATACRRSERLRFAYRDHAGDPTERTAEPLQIVHTGRRWYLVARDRERHAWRTFRVDRVTAPVLTGHRFTVTDPPDPVELVREGTAVAPWRIEARIVVHAGIDDVTRRIAPADGVLERMSEHRTMLRVGANELDAIVRWIAGLPWGFEVLDPRALRERIHAVGARLAENNA